MIEEPKGGGQTGGSRGPDTSVGRREVHPLVQAESMLQLAFMIPSGTVVGWLFGAGLDRLLHQNWIYIAGLLFGAAAGFVQLFRTVLRSTKE